MFISFMNSANLNYVNITKVSNYKETQVDENMR